MGEKKPKEGKEGKKVNKGAKGMKGGEGSQEARGRLAMLPWAAPQILLARAETRPS